VGEDDTRVGEDLEEDVKEAEVVRGLQHPALRAGAAPLLLPLEELQQALQVDVARPGSVVLEPERETRNIAEGLRGAADEGVLEEHDVLVGGVGVHGMGGDQVGRGVEHHRDLRLGVDDAGVDLRIFAVGEGRGVAGLVPQEREDARIARDRSVQHGGPGAPEADDGERAVDHLVQDFGMAADVVLGPQPVDEEPDDALDLGDASRLVEVRLLVESAEQASHGFAEVVVAEVVEPGAAARLVEDCRFFEACGEGIRHVTS